MCGIVGFLDFKQSRKKEALVSVAREMAVQIHHRGPDNQGVWIDQDAGVALGHQRLSIIDLSSTGNQPMHSSCNRYVVIYNGEIYNHESIRKELEKTGTRFKGHSDTEVLVEAISAYGIDAVPGKLNGMFAIVIWDRKNRELTLVRDRAGEKPLYYGWLGDSFLFSSELKALRIYPGWQGKLLSKSLQYFLRYNFIPAPYSIYEGIYKLLPGCSLRITSQSAKSSFSPQLNSVDNSVLCPKPYWRLSDVINSENRLIGSDQEDGVVNELDALLTDTIKQQMMADVPVGVMLSGGIDSSLVTAIMQNICAEPINTFSIGFSDSDYDEAIYASSIAKYLGTNHHELYLDKEEIVSTVPMISSVYDEPFADVSQIPTYLISKMACDKVKVCLTGDAGDELFFGYNRYFLGERLWKILRFFPHEVKKLIVGLLKVIPNEHLASFIGFLGMLLNKRINPVTIKSKISKIPEIILAKSPEQLYENLLANQETGLLLSHSHSDDNAFLWRGDTAEIKGSASMMMYRDFMYYLPDDILVKLDRASMAVSLESRIPFLDHKIIEFAWNLPCSTNMRNGEGKWLLKKLLEKYLPKSLFARPKAGFSVPLGHWLKTDLVDWSETMLDKKNIDAQGIFDSVMVNKIWHEHKKGKLDHSQIIWPVIAFQAWYQSSL